MCSPCWRRAVRKFCRGISRWKKAQAPRRCPLCRASATPGFPSAPTPPATRQKQSVAAKAIGMLLMRAKVNSESKTTHRAGNRTPLPVRCVFFNMGHDAGLAEDTLPKVPCAGLCWLPSQEAGKNRLRRTFPSMSHSTRPANTFHRAVCTVQQFCTIIPASLSLNCWALVFPSRSLQKMNSRGCYPGEHHRSSPFFERLDTAQKRNALTPHLK